MGLFYYRHSSGKDCGQNVVPQNLQDQALPRQEAETKQAHSSVDQNEDWQQDQIQLQEETLEEDQAWPVNMGISIPPSQHLPGPPAAGPERGEGAAMLSGAAVVLYRYSGYAHV